ncbi:hypothetical protein QNI19_23310 [Cytophagaceae bacterium DM2B3-1]|uniref:Uncharacterized protein n=1 Tax=Xanthocytophaga flava TaxID=3048013 RepID=A0ABT7CQ65_9BACT|nr:hypothetical protein [Xanthocytophaga flavus]MDJ1495883.1 hypothetical protein [Xanthocytophaga flavus]
MIGNRLLVITPTTGNTNNGQHQQRATPTTGNTNNGQHQQRATPTTGNTNNGQHQQRAYNVTGIAWQLPGYGADKVQLVPSPGGK